MHDLMVIGGGKMGAALVGGLVRGGWDPSSIVVSETDEHRREELSGPLAGVEVIERIGAGSSAAGAVLAVKPLDAEEACHAAAAVGATRVLSIMAGVPIASLAQWIGPGAAVLRSMPNTPALVGAGMSGLAGGPGSGEDDIEWASAILGAVGKVVRVDEVDLDAVTGVSGSGPAYVFFLVESLAKAGAEAGISEELSRILARQTVVGAGRLLEQSAEAPETLRAQVTSPGGTTAAGIAFLESSGFPASVAGAVTAAARRSRELGSGTS